MISESHELKRQESPCGEPDDGLGHVEDAPVLVRRELDSRELGDEVVVGGVGADGEALAVEDAVADAELVEPELLDRLEARGRRPKRVGESILPALGSPLGTMRGPCRRGRRG